MGLVLLIGAGPLLVRVGGPILLVLESSNYWGAKPPGPQESYTRLNLLGGPGPLVKAPRDPCG